MKNLGKSLVIMALVMSFSGMRLVWAEPPKKLVLPKSGTPKSGTPKSGTRPRSASVEDAAKTGLHKTCKTCEQQAGTDTKNLPAQAGGLGKALPLPGDAGKAR